jgi:uncharacterized protein (DUF3084 family)
MDVGLVLIATVLCLGGIIATVGDRIGMRVGKARLSLFNLRPRQTATVVSVLTGGVISASTLGLLLVTSEQLRKGLFEFEEIQSNLVQARRSLQETQTAKSKIETALATVTQQKVEAEDSLRKVNESLEDAVQREEETQSRLARTQMQLTAVSQQATSLRNEIDRLQQERSALLQRQTAIRNQIAQRDQEIQARNRELAQRDQEIAQRETQLKRLETEQAFLEEEIRRLEVEFVKLRSGSVAVSRNQTLALLLTRPSSLEAAKRDVEQALSEANRIALRSILPDATEETQILRISSVAVEQVITQLLSDENLTPGENYVVRVAASGNYIVGEPCVLAGQEPCVEVNLQTRINRVVFAEGQSLARVRLETAYPRTAELVEKLQTLLATAQVQASLEGIIIIDNPRVAGGLSEPVIEFLKDVQSYGAPLEIEAIAARPIFTTGPLFLDLVASHDGRIIFRTNLE